MIERRLNSSLSPVYEDWREDWSLWRCTIPAANLRHLDESFWPWTLENRSQNFQIL